MLAKTKRLLPLRLLLLVFCALLGAAHILISARLNSLKSEEGGYPNIHNHQLTIDNLPDRLHNVTKRSSRLKSGLKRASDNRLANFSWALEKAGQAQNVRRQQAKILEEAQHRNNISTQSETIRKVSLKNSVKRRTTKGYGNMTNDDPSLVRLREHGVNIPESEIHTIPSWSQITDILGQEPVILGLETCEQYRASVPAKDRYVAASGSFNTGTNLFPVVFRKNCQMERHTSIPQVPWGKHNLAAARLKFRTNRTEYETYRSEDALPVVMVRHPVSWMFSTCVHSYSVHWKHDNDENCPHLINVTTGQQNAARVGYGYKGSNRGKKFYKYDSLIHFWRHWYQSYAKLHNPVSFPRLIVRLEDIIYQPDKVLDAICDCAGGTRRQGKVELPEESVKIIAERKRKMAGLEGSLTKGRETSGLLKAWIDHASTASLWKRMTPGDQHVVKKVLLRDDEDRLMERFHYKLEGK